MPENVFGAKLVASERSIGLGAMGFRILQSKMPVKCISSMNLRYLKDEEQAVEENERLAIKRGEAPDMEGTGRRNAHFFLSLNTNLLLFVVQLHHQ